MMNDQRKAALRRLLITVAIGVVFGLVFSLVGEPVFDEHGGRLMGEASTPIQPWESLVLWSYVIFVTPALSFTPWYIHDAPILRGSLSGIFWSLIPFVCWWLFSLRKAR